MRKMTLELEPYEHIREDLAYLFEDLVSFEILEMLKVDYEEGITVDLIEFHLRGTRPMEELRAIGQMEIMGILGSDGDRQVCLVRYTEPEEDRELAKRFDLDLIRTTPFIVSERRQVHSVIGNDENLRRYVDLVKEVIGTVGEMSFTKAAYQRHEILSVLTDRQRELLVTAHKHGYYEYPKRINTEGLAERVDISRPTLVQHLRKAEGRLMDELLTGL
ncbi:MAG: helix-turn-helix domain-containing protein [Thermoplasmata archaeon]|nr:MAG: helix-turn-helix domain-containing protein [Thermoplasmata archaeon]